jgi:hypothetical protein
MSCERRLSMVDARVQESKLINFSGTWSSSRKFKPKNEIRAAIRMQLTKIPPPPRSLLKFSQCFSVCTAELVMSPKFLLRAHM